MKLVTRKLFVYLTMEAYDRKYSPQMLGLKIAECRLTSAVTFGLRASDAKESETDILLIPSFKYG